MFSQLRHHLSLMNPEERLPLKKYEHVALSNNKTTNIKCKAIIFNAACVDAVFDVDLDYRIKDLKELYSTEASNPHSDMLYAIDPEKCERPKPIGDGFVPASVLTLVDDEGRQFGDEEPLFPENIGESNPECCPEFTAQVFIAIFETDMPKLAQYLDAMHENDPRDNDEQDAAKCISIIRSVLFKETRGKLWFHLDHLGLRNDAGEMETRRAIEKMLFHISIDTYKLVVRGLRFHLYASTENLYGRQRTTVRFDFLITALSAGVNRFGLNDMANFFDEYLDVIADEHSSRENIVKPIMEALLKSQRVSEEDIVNHVFKKHLREFYKARNKQRMIPVWKKFGAAMIKEYFEVMDGKITAEDYRFAGLL